MSLGICNGIQSCNVSKVLLYLLVCLFFLSLALQLDESIKISYFVVFLPLFTFEMFVFMNFLASSSIYFITYPSASESVFKKDFILILFNTVEHIFISGFELLVYFKLQDIPEPWEPNTWLITFTPLFILGFISVLVMFWCMQNNKNIEAELFCVVNFIQILVIALKLNENISWSWMATFTPSWILLIMVAFFAIYFIIVSAVKILRGTDNPHAQRELIFAALFNMIVTIPIFAFLFLLSIKLDMDDWIEMAYKRKLRYRLIFTPLLISLCYLTFCALGPIDNTFWWFSFPRSFRAHCFETFPFLKIYGNVNIRFNNNSQHLSEGDEPENIESGRNDVYEDSTYAEEGQSFIKANRKEEDRQSIPLLEKDSSLGIVFCSVYNVD